MHKKSKLSYYACFGNVCYKSYSTGTFQSFEITLAAESEKTEDARRILPYKI